MPDLSKITNKNDMGKILPGLKVKYDGVTKEIDTNTCITIYNVNEENSTKACSTIKFG